jgi:hypothetical protein
MQHEQSRADSAGCRWSSGSRAVVDRSAGLALGRPAARTCAHNPDELEGMGSLRQWRPPESAGVVSRDRPDFGPGRP